MERPQDLQAGHRPDEPTGALRIGTAERERAVDALTTHTAAGRLEPEEFDERVTAAWSARTADDLTRLTADLPPVATKVNAPTPSPPTKTAPPAPVGRSPRFAPGALSVLRPWLMVSALMIVIWAASGGGYFWPVWVIGPWGVVTLASLGGRSHGHAPRSSCAPIDTGGSVGGLAPPD